MSHHVVEFAFLLGVGRRLVTRQDAHQAYPAARLPTTPAPPSRALTGDPWMLVRCAYGFSLRSRYKIGRCRFGAGRMPEPPQVSLPVSGSVARPPARQRPLLTAAAAASSGVSAGRRNLGRGLGRRRGLSRRLLNWGMARPRNACCAPAAAAGESRKLGDPSS